MGMIQKEGSDGIVPPVDILFSGVLKVIAKGNGSGFGLLKGIR
jgi:hypothetical protein